jgi:hypothetical protein
MDLQECIMELISVPSSIESFLAGTAMAAVPLRIRMEVKDYLQDKAEKILATPGKAIPVSIEVRERIRAHAGPPALVREALAEDPPPPTAEAPGSWLAAGRSKNPRPAPKDGSRIRKGIESWGMERLGDLPYHAVIVYERAAGRVKDWRDKNGLADDAQPPIQLLRALVHTDHIPTALAAPGDHFWLPALGRWASTAEVLDMFQVPRDSPLRQALLSAAVPDEEAVSHLGRAVQVGSAMRALKEAALALPTARPVRYASACSGVDTVAAGMNAVFPQGWEYVFASEENAEAAGVLTKAWSGQGLTPAWVFGDAKSSEATVDAPTVDLWVITPPCPDYSRRNHARSAKGVRQASSALDRMLEYARNRRPSAIVVENVDEPEARAAITAALLSVTGYTWVTFASDARDYTSMARSRRFWVGKAV